MAAMTDAILPDPDFSCNEADPNHCRFVAAAVPGDHIQAGDRTMLKWAVPSDPCLRTPSRCIMSASRATISRDPE
jgi:hypothetical protein